MATDYSTPCGAAPLSLIQMLAACMRIAADGTVRLNTISVSGAATALSPFWTCDNNGVDPERAMVENLFALDDDSQLALKLYDNTGQ
jgi:hypothetical protein